LYNISHYHIQGWSRGLLAAKDRLENGHAYHNHRHSRQPPKPASL
jgi:hypothetical protein